MELKTAHLVMYTHISSFFNLQYFGNNIYIHWSNFD